MIRKIQDFVEMIKEDAKATVKVFEAIPEHLKKEKVNEDVRSLERLAWHITQSNTSMLSMAGIKLSTELEDDATPATMAEIIETYKATTREIADTVANQWTDNELEEEVNMYGDNWSKGKTLYIVIGHQGHHRSQMTVIMRLLNLQVPGTWGPSKEEWALFGAPAQV